LRVLARDAGPTDEEELPMSCKNTDSLANFRLDAPCRARCVVVSLALLLNACANDRPAGDAPPSPAIPPDAIPVAPELFMRPMGTDADDCPVFQPWSPSLAVVQALHWQTAAGDFTLDREAAACAADEEP
jgi:hypothetical protein